MTPAETLRGQVALVTGGSNGIGLAIIEALKNHGVIAVSLDTLPPVREGVPWREVDVTNDEAIEREVRSIAAAHDRLDIVIHSAGVSRDSVIWKLTPEDWDVVHAVNLRGAYSLLRHSIPIMRQGRGGRIVLIGSINGARGKFGLSAYAASKAGLVGLAKSVARETARFGIGVNVVEPGMVHTRLTGNLSAEVKESAIQESLLGRIAEPSDIASAVEFLCSPAARHITGQVLRVDGGQYL